MNFVNESNKRPCLDALEILLQKQRKSNEIARETAGATQIDLPGHMYFSLSEMPGELEIVRLLHK
jgi:hypothetical protein